MQVKGLPLPGEPICLGQKRGWRKTVCDSPDLRNRRNLRFSNSVRGEMRRWLGAESNRRHEDFQSSALPTELPSLKSLVIRYLQNWKFERQIFLSSNGTAVW